MVIITLIVIFIDDLESNNIDQQSSRMGPNVIMVRTLPHMKLTVTEEQQEKFRLSIANWCLANEGLRKSIQSLQPPPSLNNNPTLSLMSSESLASICSGLQAIDKFDGGGNNCSHMGKNYGNFLEYYNWIFSEKKIICSSSFRKNEAGRI